MEPYDVLVAHGVDLSLAIEHAYRKNNLDLVWYICHKSNDSMKTGEQLILACEHAHPDIAEFLISKGADCTLSNYAALRSAVQHGLSIIVNKILEKSKLDILVIKGLVTYADQFNRVDIFNMLIDHALEHNVNLANWNLSPFLWMKYEAEFSS